MLLKNASFLNVQLYIEDASWDVGAAYGDVDHHHQDITCEHPTTHATEYVFDVVVWWGASQGLDEWVGARWWELVSSGVVEDVALSTGDVGAARRADVAKGHGCMDRLRS